MTGLDSVMELLGDIHSKGLYGQPINKGKALTCYELSCEQRGGNTTVMKSLLAMYKKMGKSHSDKVASLSYDLVTWGEEPRSKL